MMEQRTRISDREKKICRDVMKELFHVSTDFDDEDQMMHAFVRNAQNMANDLDRLLVQYDYAKYPGKKTVSDGKRLLNMICQAESTTEFYKNIQRYQDDFLDFADYYEPIRSFFKGEQKQIFDRAIRLMNIYEDSKTYIADEKLEENVRAIEDILNQQEPYNNIPKLPELLETFMNLYNEILDAQEAPVLAAIDEAENRVIEVLSAKPYKAEKEAQYHRFFADLREGAKKCNNVSSLRGFADKAEAQKMRLLNEMDKIDQDLERKRIEEEQRKAKENGGDTPVTPVVPVHQKRTKNVTIKQITRSASRRLETEADVDDFVETLRARLKQQLEDDTIVNIEF